MLSLVKTPPLPPPPQDFNLAAYVLQAAETHQDKTALIVLGANHAVMTYGELASAVRGTATGLLAAGLSPGDRVLLQLGNTPDFPIAYLGAIAAGIVPVPLSAALTAPELAVIIDKVRPTLTLCADGMAASALRRISPEKLRSFHTLPPAPYATGAPDRPAYIIFTSGTSGKPQAVVHAHRAIWARQMMWDGWYGIGAEDRILHAGAFNWSFTLGTGLLDPWSVGATALIPEDGTDIAALAQALADHEVTILAAAPGIYRRLLRHDLPRFPHLRHGLTAGETLPHAIRERWQQATGCDLHEAFGMSECSTFLSGAPRKPAPAGTIGYAQEGRCLAVLDAGQPVPRGTEGTLAVHRDDPGLMLGYLDDVAATQARYQGDWFLTGDQVVMQQDGAIAYTGRTDDMMNAGGFRVSPIEVEAALASHPQISEAAVCAVQLRRDVFVIAAFYVATDVIDEDALQHFCAARLAAYKCPRLFLRRDSLPRGANNKLLRRILRQDWEAEYGQA